MVILAQQTRQAACCQLRKEAHQRPRGTSVPSAGLLSPMSPLSFPWKWRPSGESAGRPAEEAVKAGRWWEQGPACTGCCCGPLGTLSLINAGLGTRVSLGKQNQVFPYKSNTPHFEDLGKPRNMKDNRNMKRKKRKHTVLFLRDSLRNSLVDFSFSQGVFSRSSFSPAGSGLWA